jgi:7,8-dihydroneopterin aldolase/epimerase/oxygenase
MSAPTQFSKHVANAGARIRHVFVRDLTMLALIGIHDAEKLKPQRIVVNIDLSVQESDGPMPDDISHVVSYAIIVTKCETIVAEGHVNLVETLAEKFADACLKDKRVVAARVRIEKPDIIPNAKSVGVEIERGRL